MGMGGGTMNVMLITLSMVRKPATLLGKCTTSTVLSWNLTTTGTALVANAQEMVMASRCLVETPTTMHALITTAQMWMSFMKFAVALILRSLATNNEMDAMYGLSPSSRQLMVMAVYTTLHSM